MAKEKCPVCGMGGTIGAHGNYFCSEHCLRKYEKENNLSHSPCSGCTVQSGKWYRNRFWITFVATVLVVLFSWLYTPLNGFFSAFVDYMGMIWWAIILGLLIGGVIDVYVSRERISKHLSSSKGSIPKAVFLGFLMSACSHGILAISMELYRKGASVPSVIAFLLASPWANLPVTILLFGFFGINALLLIFSAIVIAIITGYIYRLLDMKGLIERSTIAEDNSREKTEKKKMSAKEGLKGVLSGAWELNKMVTWWILIGILMAAFARAFIPSTLFMEYMGPTLIGLGVTLFFATIIEICSEGSSPLAFEIYRQTKAFGNSFTFLMAGVATDYTEIGLIWSNIGKKAAIWLPIITVPQILILGYLFNIFL